jgi:hypothetical protein
MSKPHLLLGVFYLIHICEQSVALPGNSSQGGKEAFWMMQKEADLEQADRSCQIRSINISENFCTEAVKSTPAKSITAFFMQNLQNYQEWACCITLKIFKAVHNHCSALIRNMHMLTLLNTS